MELSDNELYNARFKGVKLRTETQAILVFESNLHTFEVDLYATENEEVAAGPILDIKVVQRV